MIDPNTPLVSLETIYQSAFLGCTVAVQGPPRLVYSLPLLARREQARSRVGLDRAQEIISELVRQVTAAHGNEAPVFLDDSITRAPETPTIIIDGV